MKSIRIVLSPTRSRPVNIFLGLLLALVSLLLFLALATYRASDPSLNTATDPALAHAARNWIGIFGAYLGDLLLQSLGVTAFLLPLWLGAIGWSWMRSRADGPALLRWIGILFTLTFLPALFGLLPWHWRWLHVLPVEGVVGRLMAGVLVGYLNIQGAWIVGIVLAAAGVYFASAISIRGLKEGIEDRWLRASAWLERWRNQRQERAEERAEREALLAGEEGSNAVPVEPRRHWFGRLFGRRRREDESDLVDEIPAFQRVGVQRPEREIPITAPTRKPSIWERAETPAAPPAAGPVPVPPAQPRSAQPQPAQFQSFGAHPAETRPAPLRPEPGPAPAAASMGEIAIHSRADAEVRTATVAPKNMSGFKLPPSTLLNAGDGPQTVREEALREEAKVLVEKCAEFDVRGQVVQINPGPMVTTYEFKPEAGVKYSRVTGLADDLCLAMRAESILIERMPGKSTVGIQVPNYERETIHLRDVLESETFAKAKSRLTLSMGKDINGRIVTADLASMPHVLIAGSTGSGKSVAINAMIMSLLYRTTPAQVRLILVDPKRVELGMYEGIPHLFTPIITEPKLAANALRNAVREMERRLKLLASRSVRNIDQYNKLFEGSMPSLFDDGEPEEPLPYIVI
ncbi:MAG: DNA translocase FtsK, partial [Acidobacteriota bacterium]|nr:DNA translocase FtsK [Acidobacteriota bacterium]